MQWFIYHTSSPTLILIPGCTTVLIQELFTSKAGLVKDVNFVGMECLIHNI